MITVFPNITNTKNGIIATPHVIVESIKTGGQNNKVKDLVSVIRKTQDKSKRNSIKSQLPCILWSGIFTERKKSKLRKHSGLICLDFDNIENVEDVKEELCADKYVYCCFISPSGNGLKVVVKIPQDEKHHQDYFRSLAGYFDWIDIDSSAKDVSRVCYASYDVDVYFNPDSERWENMQRLELKKTISKSSTIGESLPDSESLNIIRKAIDNQIDFVSGQKHEHLLKFAGYANRSGIPLDDAVNYYDSKYDKQDVNKIMSNVYRNYSIEHGKQPITAQASNGKQDNTFLTFWDVLTDKKGNQKIVFSRVKFIEWLRLKGFGRYHYTSDNWALIIHEDNIVQKVSKSQLKTFVFDFMDKLPNQLDGVYLIQIKELVARGVNSFFSDELLELLPEIDINTHRDTATDAYLYYQNCVVKWSKCGLDLIKYTDLDGYVWKDHISDRSFKVLDDFINDYSNFVWIVCGSRDKGQTEETLQKRIDALQRAIGFSLHSYKDPVNCPTIMIYDETQDSENPEGGTGKGIFLNGLACIKNMCKIGGKLHSLDSTFAFQRVDVDTQLLVFEDVKKGWDFEKIFSITTEGITIEKKNKDAFFIPFNKSAKIFVTSNYPIKGQGSSHERRRLELEFNGYFRDKPPFEHFGRRLFDDWDADDWLKFDNYMVYCLGEYMKHGLIKPPIINLDERKLVSRTHQQFVTFMRQWLQEGRFSYRKVHVSLNGFNRDFERYGQTTITRWVNIYLKHEGIDYKKVKVNDGIHNINGFEITKLTKNTQKDATTLGENEVVESTNEVDEVVDLATDEVGDKNILPF